MITATVWFLVIMNRLGGVAVIEQPNMEQCTSTQKYLSDFRVESYCIPGANSNAAK